MCIKCEDVWSFVWWYTAELRRWNDGSATNHLSCIWEVWCHTLCISNHVEISRCYSDFSVCQPAAGCISWHSVWMFSGPQQRCDFPSEIPLWMCLTHIQTRSFGFYPISPTEHWTIKTQHRICGGTAQAQDGRSGHHIKSAAENFHTCTAASVNLFRSEWQQVHKSLYYQQ